MTGSLLLLLLASLPTMEHGVAPVHSGRVVSAPHEGFDDHTAPIARSVGEALGWGWLVATGYRKRSEERWLDVNRPTQRVWVEGAIQRRSVTEAARAVYGQYQARLQQAARRAPKEALSLLVEIHGHARQVKIDGKSLKVQVIELATCGFSKPELELLRERYQQLQATLPERDRILLAVEQLDPEYKWRGQTLRFYFGAGGSKRRGALRPERTRRALHFELPSSIRFNATRRACYQKLLVELLRPY